MPSTEKKNLQQQEHFPKIPDRQNVAYTFIHEFSAKEMKEAILPMHSYVRPIDELIAIGEAVFEFIRNSDIELDTKNAFWQLEKQFYFYKKLVEPRRY